MVIQIDGLHVGNDLVLVAALGIDGEGHKHPLGLVEGATENAAVVQALIDNLMSASSSSQACRSARRTEACSDLGSRSVTLRAL